MMDINEIRHRNVRLLVSQLEAEAGTSGMERSGGLVMLAQKLGKAAPQVSHFAAEKPTKNIGDKIAREIEKAFHLDRGWLDWAQWEVAPGEGPTSLSLRLDPERIAELARVLDERYKAKGQIFDIRDEQCAAWFTEGYSLFLNMKERPTPKNLVAFSKVLETSPQGAQKNERGADVPVKGTAQ